MTSAIGAEVHGIDLSQAGPAELDAIHQLLLEHEVIFFRDQDISPAHQTALASHFGPLQSHPAYSTVEGHPEVTILESTQDKPTKIEAWHSDMTYLQHPPMATMLRSKIIPSHGGDTMWASTTTAYDTLSAPLQKMLDGLTAIHDFRHGFRHSLAEPGGHERLASAVAENPPVVHPVVQSHPETGKPVLFVNSLFTTRIVELSESESDAVLAMLYEHIILAEHCCRFRWQENSVALWDNRSTQHKPVNDYFPAHRMMHRITVYGDKPF